MSKENKYYVLDGNGRVAFDLKKSEAIEKATELCTKNCKTYYIAEQVALVRPETKAVLVEEIK